MKKILIVATSLDGYIAQNSEQVSTAWTSEADKKWFGQISRKIGVMIMGRPTYETIGFPLPGRKTVVMTRGEDFVAAAMEEFTLDGETTLYKTGAKTPGEIIQGLEKRGVKQVAICGGARVYEAFLRAKQVDELLVTIEPVFLGGGIKLMQSENLDADDFPWRFRVLEKLEISPETMVWHLRRN